MMQPSKAHDNRRAAKLLSRMKSGSMLLANRGYDADWIRTLVRQPVPGRISLQGAIGKTRSASARICTALEIWSNGSSTRSSSVGEWLRAREVSANYLAFIQVASIRVWLPANESTPY
jgi:hypothetical protein